MAKQKMSARTPARTSKPDRHGRQRDEDRNRSTPTSPATFMHRDNATAIDGAPPNFGRQLLPQIITFSGRSTTWSKIYLNPDQAIQHSRENARNMRNDPSIMECLEARQRGTALLNWHLEAEDQKDPAQKQLVTDLTAIIQRIPRFTEYRRNLLEALWYGRYAVQHKWGQAHINGKRRTTLVGWTPIHGDKLVFRFDDGDGLYNPDEIGIRCSMIHNTPDVLQGNRKLEMTDWGMAYFTESWERPLLAIHKHIIEDGAFEDTLSAGRIHGVGIRDRIYWCWYQKQETMAHLMEVIERTGTGFTIYFYESGNDESRKAMEKIANEQSANNVILIPKVSGDPSMDVQGIERIEPTTAGIDALKSIIHEFFGHQIKRYILGQILSSESAATGLGSGVADLHESTYFQIIQYDACGLEETLTTDLVEPIKAYNFPKMRNVYVKFRIDTKENEVEQKLQACKQAWDMGAKLKASDIMDLIGFSAPTEDDEVLQNPAMMQQSRLWEQAHGGGAGGMGGEAPPQGSPEDMFGPLMGMLNGGGEQPGEGGDDQQGGPDGGGDNGQGPQPPGGQRPQKYAKEYAEAIKQAIEDTERNPSDAQRESGNYRKGKVLLHGLTVTIENPKGSKRRPEWKPLASHYGYINRTEGRDGDHVDIFLGPNPESEVVFVVDQCSESGRFDEHKVMLGWNDEKSAKEAYLANYQAGWKCGPITALTMPQFKAWLADGDMSQRVESQVSKYAKIRYASGVPTMSGLTGKNSKTGRRTNWWSGISGQKQPQHQVGETKVINGKTYQLNENHRWELNDPSMPHRKEAFYTGGSQVAGTNPGSEFNPFAMDDNLPGNPNPGSDDSGDDSQDTVDMQGDNTAMHDDGQEDHARRVAFVQSEVAKVHPAMSGIFKTFHASNKFKSGAEVATKTFNPKQANQLYDFLKQNVGQPMQGKQVQGGFAVDLGQGRLGYASTAGSIVVWPPDESGKRMISYTAKTGVVNRAGGLDQTQLPDGKVGGQAGPMPARKDNVENQADLMPPTQNENKPDFSDSKMDTQIPGNLSENAKTDNLIGETDSKPDFTSQFTPDHQDAARRAVEKALAKRGQRGAGDKPAEKSDRLKAAEAEAMKRLGIGHVLGARGKDAITREAEAIDRRMGRGKPEDRQEQAELPQEPEASQPAKQSHRERADTARSRYMDSMETWQSAVESGASAKEVSEHRKRAMAHKAIWKEHERNAGEEEKARKAAEKEAAKAISKPKTEKPLKPAREESNPLLDAAESGKGGGAVPEMSAEQLEAKRTRLADHAKRQRLNDWENNVDEHFKESGIEHNPQHSAMIRKAIDDGHISDRGHLETVLNAAKRAHEKGDMSAPIAPYLQHEIGKRANRAEQERKNYDQVIRDRAEEHGMDESTLRQLADDHYEEFSSRHGEREAAKKAAKTITGLHAGDIQNAENDHKDYSHPDFGDLSVAGQELARQYNGLGWGNGDDENTPYDQHIWELMKEQSKPVPSRVSPEFWDHFGKYLNQQAGETPYESEGSREERKRENERIAKEMESVPFAKQGKAVQY